ncbi:hypothetical protein PtB15_2B55 [Puccinia triticina]|nr:hypothetical protein PtB15_2B55 [Puccinia triticina]
MSRVYTLNKTNTPIAPCAADCSLRHQSLLAPPITPCASSLGHHFLPSPTNSTTLNVIQPCPLPPQALPIALRLPLIDQYADRSLRTSVRSLISSPVVYFLTVEFPLCRLQPYQLPPQAPPFSLRSSLQDQYADSSFPVFARSPLSSQTCQLPPEAPPITLPPFAHQANGFAVAPTGPTNHSLLVFATY